MHNWSLEHQNGHFGAQTAISTNLDTDLAVSDDGLDLPAWPANDGCGGGECFNIDKHFPANKRGRSPGWPPKRRFTVAKWGNGRCAEPGGAHFGGIFAREVARGRQGTSVLALKCARSGSVTNDGRAQNKDAGPGKGSASESLVLLRTMVRDYSATQRTEPPLALLRL